jgi:hypothetical protein
LADPGPAPGATQDGGAATGAAQPVVAGQSPADGESGRAAGGGPPRSALVDAFGGKRGLVDSGLPAVVFVFVNSLVGALADRQTGLDAAIAAAVATGVAVVLLRLVRRETLQQAVSGFLGLAVAVWFARRSGEARGFFLPGIFINIGYGLVFLVSALIGRPWSGRSTLLWRGWTPGGDRTTGCAGSSPSPPSAGRWCSPRGPSCRAPST